MIERILQILRMGCTHYFSSGVHSLLFQRALTTVPAGCTHCFSSGGALTAFPAGCTHCFSSSGVHSLLFQRGALTAFLRAGCTHYFSIGVHSPLFQRGALTTFPAGCTHYFSSGVHSLLFQRGALANFPARVLAVHFPFPLWNPVAHFSSEARTIWGWSGLVMKAKQKTNPLAQQNLGAVRWSGCRPRTTTAATASGRAAASPGAHAPGHPNCERQKDARGFFIYASEPWQGEPQPDSDY